MHYTYGKLWFQPLTHNDRLDYIGGGVFCVFWSKSARYGLLHMLSPYMLRNRYKPLYQVHTRLHCMVYGYSCSHVLVSQLTKVSVESKVINKSRGFMRWLYGWALFYSTSCVFYPLRSGNGQLVSVLILCTSSAAAATLFALFDRYTNIKYNIIFTAVVYIKKGKYFENAK